MVSAAQIMTLEDCKAHHRETNDFLEMVLKDGPKQRVFGGTNLKTSYNIRDYTNPSVFVHSMKTRTNPGHTKLDFSSPKRVNVRRRNPFLGDTNIGTYKKPMISEQKLRQSSFERITDILHASKARDRGRSFASFVKGNVSPVSKN